jgi:hypothetical protein
VLAENFLKPASPAVPKTWQFPTSNAQLGLFGQFSFCRKALKENTFWINNGNNDLFFGMFFGCIFRCIGDSFEYF